MAKATTTKTKTAPKATTRASVPAERSVIVTTEHKGVFWGYAKDTAGDRINLRSARMAIYFGTTRGVMELAETGPTSSSKVSARADIEIRRITAVFEVTPEATAKWEAK